MKNLLLLFVLIFASSVFGQKKASIKPKPTPPAKITVIQATTKDGKTVDLRSDKTWEYSTPVVTSVVNTEIKKCELTLKDVPALHGLKVGMARNEIERLFSGERMEEIATYLGGKLYDRGVILFEYYYRNLEKYPDFRDVEELEMYLWRDVLHKVVTRYKKSSGDFSQEQLREKLSQSFNLSPDLWQSNTISCKDFELSVDRSHEISLTNLITSQEIKESEERKRKSFQP